MDADHTAYLATFAAAAAYALVLHWLDRAYEPDWTILTVVGGVALTGAGVAYRFTLGVPDAAPLAVAWWVWWLCCWHFCASGAAIALWQAWQARRRLRALLTYLREGRPRGNTPNGAA